MLGFRQNPRLQTLLISACFLPMAAVSLHSPYRRPARRIMPGDKPDSGTRGTGPQPHYLGHRERLRERFRLAGDQALADYELLELILFRALPRGDVKPLA